MRFFTSKKSSPKYRILKQTFYNNSVIFKVQELSSYAKNYSDIRVYSKELDAQSYYDELEDSEVIKEEVIT